MTRTWIALAAFLAIVPSGCGGDEKGGADKEYVTVPSPSMEPGLIRGQRVEVHRKDGDQVRVGEIVVFEAPGGWLAGGGKSIMIKRVLGVGGDHVECNPAKGGSLLVVNGLALHENYLPENTLPCDQAFDVQVAEGHLWLMGDNRGDSADSRAHLGDPGGGMVDTDLVRGVITP